MVNLAAIGDGRRSGSIEDVIGMADILLVVGKRAARRTV